MPGPTEIVAARTRHSKTFDMDGHRRRVVSRISQIHVKRDGRWLDIDTRLDDQGHVRLAPYDVRLLKGKIGYEGADPAGREIGLEVLDLPCVEPEIQNVTRRIENCESGISRVVYPDVASGMDIEFWFLPDRIQCLRRHKAAGAPATVRFRTRRSPLSPGGLINRGVDNEQRKTKIAVEFQDFGVPNERIMAQTWEGKVQVMDPKTRERAWSDDVKYPVIIDPTSTFAITSNADDGCAWCFGTTSPSLNPSYSRAMILDSTSLPYKAAGFLRFSISGIAQSSHVATATVKLYARVYGGSGPEAIKLRAVDSSAPSNPISATAVLTPTNLITGTASTSITNATGYTTDKSTYNLYSVDVQAIVQALVNAYDYTMATHMLFLAHSVAVGSGGVLIYNRDWGTSKDAELVIETAELAYNLYRGEGGISNVDFSSPVGTVMGAASSQTFTGLGHSADTRYTYVLRPVRQDAGGNDLETPDMSCRVEFETDSDTEWLGDRPGMIEALSAEVIDSGKIRLRWRYRTAYGGSAPNDFGIYYGTDPNITPGSPNTTESYTADGVYSKDITLSDGVAYYFAMTARTSGGVESHLSGVIGPYIADSTAPDAPNLLASTTF